MLPPKNSLRTGITRTSSRPSDSISGVITGAPSSPVSTPIGAPRRGRNEIVDSPAEEVSLAAGRPRAQTGVGGRVRRGVDRREEPATDPGGLVGAPVELGFERTRHPDAVLVHREPVVAFGGRERAAAPSGSTRRRRTPSACRASPGTRPASRRRCRRPLGPRRRVWKRIAASPLNFEMPSGTTATESSSGNRSRMPAIVSSSTAPSLTPGQTTIWPRTTMSWSSRARSHRRLMRTTRVLQHLAAHVGVGGVDADTCNGESRSVITRSRSASVNRVRVVKFPYRNDSR